MEVKSKKTTGRKPDRLGFKLAAVFGITFALTVVLLTASSLIWGAFVDKKPAAPRIVASTGIDPKLEEGLVAALEFDEVPSIDRVTDPFVDRQGLAKEVAVRQQAPAPSVINSAPPGFSPSTVPSGQGGVSSQEERPNPIEETKARWAKRIEDLRIGKAVSQASEVFAVEDLFPVAVAGGGQGPEEIIFFSIALDRTISFPIGTRLHNGWVSASRREGVSFVLDGSPRSSILKGWGKPDLKVKGGDEK